jgi:hypothetical protein
MTPFTAHVQRGPTTTTTTTNNNNNNVKACPAPGPDTHPPHANEKQVKQKFKEYQMEYTTRAEAISAMLEKPAEPAKPKKVWCAGGGGTVRVTARGCSHARL